ncbi:hypothetical protein [Xanthomonas translucens]|uniref:Uncharacterized protein n=2 Tax=Xanthomonas campestris pv. translucens TaxID=343 RepID=A0A120EZ69_XANCT|nr:hypothetical protein [Xanthomonas translucens]KWV17135.1 hypothetical protein ATB53_00190 [Xanthomonas translucens]QSQ34709.1 hypothetical protein ISN31_03535 [Xanthomonas translucens pv. translucens]
MLHVVQSDRPPTEGELSELGEAIRRMQKERNLFFAYNREMAIILRNEYDEYVAAGFTQAQALKLVSAKLTPPAK